MRLKALVSRLGISVLLILVGIGTVLYTRTSSLRLVASGSNLSVVGARYHGHQQNASPPTIIRDGQHDEYLAACVVAQDQALDLPEFLQHHYYDIGIQRFYILDDGSRPPLSNFASTFGIPEEVVDFIHHDRVDGPAHSTQAALIEECVKVWAVNNTWVAVIDVDEFFWTAEDESLQTILKQLEDTRSDVGALKVDWMMHTSSNARLHTPSCRETFLECIYDDPAQNGTKSDNRHIKSIVRPRFYAKLVNPHKFHLLDGRITVGEHGDEIKHFAYRQPITRDRVGLHHYVVKSWEDYRTKLTRSQLTWDFWNHVEHQLPHQACPEMLKYLRKP